jgi:hypothetical protein
MDYNQIDFLWWLTFVIAYLILRSWPRIKQRWPNMP